MNKALKECELFKEFEEGEISKLAEIARERQLNVGEILFNEGSESTSFFVVKSGSIRIEVTSGEDDQEVAVFSTGSYFGELGLASRSAASKRSAAASAAEVASVIEIPYSPLREFLDSHHKEASSFYKCLATSLALRMVKTTQDFANLKGLRLRST